MLVLDLSLSGTSRYEIFNWAAVEKITNKNHTASSTSKPETTIKTELGNNFLNQT